MGTEGMNPEEAPVAGAIDLLLITLPMIKAILLKIINK